MLSTSWEFRKKIVEDTRCLIKARLDLANGESHWLSGEDIMDGGVTFSHATSSSGSFDIGACVTGSFSCTLFNQNRKFDSFDFTGSAITVFVGMEFDDGNVEWLQKGTYWLEQPASYGTSIGISGLDNMCLLDEVMFSNVKTTFPARAAILVQDICEACGIQPLAIDFANRDYVFPVRPKDDMSCHDALSYICQATGNYARITNEGKLDVTWYNLHSFEDEDWLDGEEFDDGNPYQSGSNADGGNFFDYSTGDVVDGGTLNADRIVGVVAYSSATVVVDDVIITGIKVTASDEQPEDGTQGSKGETHLQGVEGYVLDVDGNPFIAYGESANVARNLYNQMGGMVFRPFDVSCLGDPSVEPGDPIVITDYNQRTYRSFITQCTYKMGAYAALSCGAETPLRRAAAAGSAMTRVLQAARDIARAEKTARETAIEQLNRDLENSNGMYATTEKDSSGAITYYMHDKSTIKESQYIWKINAAGLGISTNGGKSYDLGLSKWGDAILNTIYAVGINADYITAGALRVKDAKGKTIFCADIRTREFWWSSDGSSMDNSGHLTIKSGNVGYLWLDAKGISYNRTTHTGQTYGVFISQTGISCGNDAQWIAMYLGSLFGGFYKGGVSDGGESGYVTFNLYEEQTKIPGTAIGGKGGLWIMSPNLFVSDWIKRTDISPKYICYKGATKTVAAVTDISVAKHFTSFSIGGKTIRALTDIDLTRYLHYITFKKGLCV